MLKIFAKKRVKNFMLYIEYVNILPQINNELS